MKFFCSLLLRLFMGCGSGGMTAYGKLIGDVPEIAFRLPNLVQKLNRILKDEHLFVCRHIANEM